MSCSPSNVGAACDMLMTEAVCDANDLCFRNNEVDDCDAL